jgi:low temperature requirement protein LtrA
LQHERVPPVRLTVFVAWKEVALYADRFDSDDVVFRASILAEMLAIAALAILIPEVWRGERSTGFALAYVSLRLVMVALYGRAYRSVPAARPLLRRYILWYSVAVVLWLVSLAFPEPERYVIWGIALVLELSVPPLSSRLIRATPFHAGHASERFGLFTIIVFGESVIVAALGVSAAELELQSALAAALGFLVIACLWWLYFDDYGTVFRAPAPWPIVFYYGHLPLLTGLAAVAAGISLLIEQTHENRLTTGATVALVCGSALFLSALLVAQSVIVRWAWSAVVRARLAAIACCALLFGLAPVLPPIAVVSILFASLLVLVAIEGTCVRSEARRQAEASS